jgi:hypothetical protein
MENIHVASHCNVLVGTAGDGVTGSPSQAGKIWICAPGWPGDDPSSRRRRPSNTSPAIARGSDHYLTGNRAVARAALQSSCE